jgi:hypothetical protein
MIRCVGREVKIESVPLRVARAALQLDETGVNGSSFHAQTGQFRQDERGLGLVQIPPSRTTFPLVRLPFIAAEPPGANEVLTGVPK